MPYELHGWGSDLAIAVSGPDVAACCAAGVEGFAASFVSVPADAPRRRIEVLVQADEPADLLAELLDEAIVHLDAHGGIAVGLSDARVQQHRLTGQLEVVALDEVELTGAVPKAVTWHDRRLAETDEGWAGQVVLDL